jgi:hypothetical protein
MNSFLASLAIPLSLKQRQPQKQRVATDLSKPTPLLDQTQLQYSVFLHAYMKPINYFLSA